MNNKTLSIISYITLIGWLIAYFSGKDNMDSPLKYHLKQSLGLIIVSVLFNIGITILVGMIPSLYFLTYVGYLIFALLIIGVINAANETEKPLPLIGTMFENKFSFIG